MSSNKVSILVPVYNEASNLERLFKLFHESACLIDREFVVVNDASTDGSREILEILREKYSFKLLHLDKNGGKGEAIRKGLKVCSGDFFLIQDADFEYDPRDIPELLSPLIENNADVVYGSRFKKNSVQIHRTYHYFINRFLTLLSNLMSGLYVSDMETCYKAFRMALVKSMNLKSKRFGIEVELTAYISKKENIRVFEVPIRYYPRKRLQGKKDSSFFQSTSS